jgi:hypothetical protein
MKYVVWALLALSGAMANAEDASDCDLKSDVTEIDAVSAEKSVGTFKVDGTVEGEIKPFDKTKVKYACAWEKKFGLLWVQYEDRRVLLDPGELKLSFSSKPCAALAQAPSAPAGKSTVAAAGVGCKDPVQTGKEKQP